MFTLSPPLLGGLPPSVVEGQRPPRSLVVRVVLSVDSPGGCVASFQARAFALANQKDLTKACKSYAQVSAW